MPASICASATQLARGGLRLAFQALPRRLANLRLSRGSDSIRWIENYTAYGPNQVWMAFDLRT